MDDPPKTDALTAYREALEWREKGSTQVGRRPVVRLVAGTAGSGKSCGLAWCATHHRRSAEFVSASRIAATPRNGWSENESAWSRWLKVDLLCIDEVGCEKGDTAALALLIAERYNQGLATLLSGNISRKDFGERYRDERLADRLRNGQGMGGLPDGLAWYVQVTGESLRNPANAARLTGDAA
jgi:DNA replication protein DnaC